MQADPGFANATPAGPSTCSHATLTAPFPHTCAESAATGLSVQISPHARTSGGSTYGKALSSSSAKSNSRLFARIQSFVVRVWFT